MLKVGDACFSAGEAIMNMSMSVKDPVLLLAYRCLVSCDLCEVLYSCGHRIYATDGGHGFMVLY